LPAAYLLCSLASLFVTAVQVPEMIDDYSFGRITVDGTEYSADVIIFPDGRVQSSWWREKGHRLTADDIADLIAAGPDVIIAGTGALGLVRTDKGLAAELAGRGVELRAMNTGKAVEVYNRLCAESKVGACLHLAC
jgi:hypothetical protein